MEREAHNGIFVLEIKTRCWKETKAFDEPVAFGKSLVLHDVLSKQDGLLLKRNKSQEIPQKDM